MSHTIQMTLLVLLVAFVTVTERTLAADRPRRPVVVELFTSEGCSSCPPADELLAQLMKRDAVKEAEVLPLEFHVDYWNRLGWADPFSAAAFSQRQKDYAQLLHSDGIYTPQMIVDGSEQFVGSDAAKAVAAIRRAARMAKGTVTMSASPVSKNAKSVEIDLVIDSLPENTGTQVMLAVTEAGLSTKVLRGENTGRQLAHVAVVRSLTGLITLQAAQALPLNKKATIDIAPGWRADQLRVILFVQEQKTGKVIAAASERIVVADSER